MINRQTGEFFQRPLENMELGWIVVNDKSKTAEEKFEELTNLGLELEEMLELAFNAADQEKE